MTANPHSCPSCGAANDPGTLVCRQCGGEISFAAGQPAPFASYPPPFSDAPAAPAPPSPPAPPTVPTPPVPAPPVAAVPPAPALEPLEIVLEPEPAVPEADGEVRRLVAAGRKVQAIVLLRERTGMSPAAAKAVVDELARTLAPEPHEPRFASDRRPAAPTMPPAPPAWQAAAAPPAEPVWQAPEAPQPWYDAEPAGAAGDAAGGELPPADLAPLFPGIDITPEVEAAVCDLTMRGMKIQAIQVLRANTGLGLAEAKAAVDRLALVIGAPSTRPAGCFIATACYGSAEHPDVVALRRFRDERLLPTSFGRAAVNAYYAASPPVARWLERRAGLSRLIRRVALEPLARRLRP